MKEFLSPDELNAIWKEKELIIFDFDGTLLDSMPMWKHLGSEYIMSQGITPPSDLDEKLVTMTLEQSGMYYIKELGLKKIVDEYIRDIYDLVYDKYKNVLELKPGAAKFVETVSNAGKRICILTTTIRKCVEGAAAHRGLDRWISPDRIFTCSELKMVKTSPDIYQHVTALMGSSPKDTLVFEDAPFAIKSAKGAGCMAGAVYDPSALEEEEIIRTYGDFQIRSFEEFFDGRTAG